MIINTPSNQQELNKYKKLLELMGSLSNLFSESTIPFIHYRVVENVFCKVFGAENLSRSDGAYDAKIGTIGVGLKTFTSPSGITNEKVAEFNSLSQELRKLEGEELAYKVSQLRNDRIQFANDLLQIQSGVYHCIARVNKELKIFETSYDFIKIEDIKDVKKSQAGIKFNDGINLYSYNYSKSTLYKKFTTQPDSISVGINIIEDPYEYLIERLSIELRQDVIENDNIEIPGKDYVILPLYSLKFSTPEKKVVAEKSGLNQWNAGGRVRDFGELYIPVPADIHNHFPDFFPNSNDIYFNLETPDHIKYQASMCQENRKGLMTNPNKALSDWMLRRILKLKEGELLTYKRLNELGVDSVKVNKIDNGNYTIDFASVGSYDEFVAEMNIE